MTLQFPVVLSLAAIAQVVAAKNKKAKSNRFMNLFLVSERYGLAKG